MRAALLVLASFIPISGARSPMSVSNLQGFHARRAQGLKDLRGTD
jgi:hypothetical protein